MFSSLESDLASIGSSRRATKKSNKLSSSERAKNLVEEEATFSSSHDCGEKFLEPISLWENSHRRVMRKIVSECALHSRSWLTFFMCQPVINDYISSFKTQRLMFQTRLKEDDYPQGFL